jgi:hypothetical protein
MRTDDLIDRLAASPARRGMSPDQLLALAIGGGLLVVATAFAALIGPRPDIAAALQTWRFDSKFVFTLGLAVSALAVLRPALYPGARSRPWLLLIAPVFLALLVVVELVTLPAAGWSMAQTGKNAIKCLTIVPGLGIVPLILLVLAIRNGAPVRPGLAGFAAGLVAGGLAATFYAANCIDDSPLFVASWYPIAILALGIVGAVAGRLAARW